MTYPLIHVTAEASDEERRLIFEKKITYHHDPHDALFQHASIHKKPYRRTWLLQLTAVIFLAGIGIRCILLVRLGANEQQPTRTGMLSDNHFENLLPRDIPRCKSLPCFSPAKIRVNSNHKGFPSFWNYAHHGPLEVDYDHRSVTINGTRVFFLGGSMHPSRATKNGWNYALDEAVRNGLNLITIYVMWGAHQPVPSRSIDWSFPNGVGCEGGNYPGSKEACEWTLATAIRAAAERGLFVHLRIGPYDCAEYNYGGIPEWLALHRPKMAMRRPNREWLEVMEGFVKKVIDYITVNKLWAYQGGNILMGQIENELGGEVDPVKEHLLLVDKEGNFVDPDSREKPNGLRNATLQDYASWCGDLVDRLAPKVTWTMCNGLSAKNTILTCNAVDGTNFLESHGDNSRIQIDQPAMLTEFEGGFQTWGETPDKPEDYFWGRTARVMAKNAMRWFARGGTHLNYYMWWGGYNRERSAGAGITNMYASDVALCPSGERRQPKYGHLGALHQAIRDIVPTLLNADTALNRGQPIPFKNDKGLWELGDDQRMFEYQANERTVIFLENDSEMDVVVRVAIAEGSTKILSMSASSGVLIVDGMIEFDSASIEPQQMAFKRKFASENSLPLLMDWSSWAEPVGAHSSDPMTWTDESPVEQTELNVDNHVYSDYAWYETSISIENDVQSAQLFIETQKASAILVYIDNRFVGYADHHYKEEGSITLEVHIGSLQEGNYKLSFLSESLGYLNLIGRWGGGTDAKLKGITGDVLLSVDSQNISLVDGREWYSYPGLHGESISSTVSRSGLNSELNDVWDRSSTPTWSSALFDTPRYDTTSQGLYLQVTSGRGHVWLNGRDLGRYWNITRGTTADYTQQYYLLPDDYLHTDGRLNDIVLFDAFGETNRESRSSAKLVLSWIDPTDSPNFNDEVDHYLACLE